MKTKTGLILKEKAEAILKTISGMSKKPKRFALAINPADDKDALSIISEILMSKDFLRENAFSFSRMTDKTWRIVILINP